MLSVPYFPSFHSMNVLIILPQSLTYHNIERSYWIKWIRKTILKNSEWIFLFFILKSIFILNWSYLCYSQTWKICSFCSGTIISVILGLVQWQVQIIFLLMFLIKENWCCSMASSGKVRDKLSYICRISSDLQETAKPHPESLKLVSPWSFLGPWEAISLLWLSLSIFSWLLMHFSLYVFIQTGLEEPYHFPVYLLMSL